MFPHQLFLTHVSPLHIPPSILYNEPQSGAKKSAAPKTSKPSTASAPKVAGPPADKNILYPAVKKNLRIGNAVLPAGRDLSRFVKWPRNVRLQRQKKVIYDRLKVPPSINQFSQPLDRAEALPFFQLLVSFVPAVCV